MTIFQHTITQVLDGTKSRTSRLRKPDQHTVLAADGTLQAILSPTYVARYQVGHTYAAQPARGAKALARFRVLALGEYDVRDITPDEARREGFEHKADFLNVWCRMYDWRWYRNCILESGAFALHRGLPHPDMWDIWYRYLADRPAWGSYLAWWIDFEVLGLKEALGLKERGA